MNQGPGTATGAAVADTFPSTFTNVTYTATATGGATGFTAAGTGSIADTVTMPAGSTITSTATGTIAPSATGTLSNTATVTPPTGVLVATATHTDTLTPHADLGVTKTGPPTALPGTNASYALTVTNHGPSDAPGLSLNDASPPGTTFVSETHPAGWNCTDPPVGTNGAVTCSVPTLAASATAPFSVFLHTGLGSAPNTNLTGLPRPWLMVIMSDHPTAHQ